MGSSCDSSVYAVNARVHEIPGEVEILSKPHHTTRKQDTLPMEGHSPNGRKRKSGEPIKFCKEELKFSSIKNTKFEAPKIVSGECMEVEAIESSLKTALESLQHYKKRDLDFRLIKDQLVRSKAEIKQLTDQKNILAVYTKKTRKWYREMKQILTQEKQQIIKEKDEMTDSLKNAQKEVEQKSDQLKEVETQFTGLKAELQHLAEEKDQIRKMLEEATDEIAGSLKNAQKEVEQKNHQLKEFETQFAGLKAELQRLAEEKDQIRKVLEEATEVLQRKERGYHAFIDIDDSLNCSICMEPWTQSGEHNICSLACGHFFGKSCITKWIKQTGASSSKCPQCLESASVRDIRSHYLQQISVVDKKIPKSKKIIL